MRRIWSWFRLGPTRCHWWFALALMVPLSVSAQVRPGAFSTLTTTDTTADSVHVGCAVGSSSCTGGIKAGPVDVSQVVSAGAITIASNVPGITTNKLYNNGGTLTWNGSPLAAGGAVGPGTAGKLAKFTAANAVGDSICSEAGTTITCVNTIAATTGTFTTLTGTLTAGAQGNITTANGITSASSLATVGTITSGTWQGNVIDLARGGAGVSLVATGGTSQFLRQNSVGATITVVRPAISDLSDASNVALLNVANAFTSNSNAALRQTFTNSSTGTASVAGWSATAGSTALNLDAYSQGFTTSTYQVQAGAAIVTGGAGGLSIGALDAAGIVRIYTGGANLRWGWNAAGDHTFGTSAHIADSNGTPTISSGFGVGPSIAGQDYAFVVTAGSGSPTSGTVNFGHTWTTAPVCAVTPTAAATVNITTSTTQISITTSVGLGIGPALYVLCRSY